MKNVAWACWLRFPEAKQAGVFTGLICTGCFDLRGDKGGVVVLGWHVSVLLLLELHHWYLHGGIGKRTVALRLRAYVCTGSTVLDLKVM